MKCSGTSGRAARDPPALGLDLVVGVVLAGDEQRRDLEPDVGLVHEVAQRVEHRLQVRAAELEVELVGERLEVDVRRVHLRVELAARLGVDVAGRHRDRLHAARMAGVGDVHRVLGEDHRVVVGERDALAAQAQRGAAIASGEAWSCSRSISRDFEMSQFWQNLQARLQPAVPNERTLEPG